MFLLCIWDRDVGCSGNTGIVTLCKQPSVSGCPPTCPPVWNHARALPLVYFSCGKHCYVSFPFVIYQSSIKYIYLYVKKKHNKERLQRNT